MPFPNQEIMNAIRYLGIKIRRRLIEEWNRDSSGKLTRWKTGRRFLCTDVPAKPVPRNLRIGFFTASLYTKERRVRTCSNCLSKGHQSSVSEAPTKCRQLFADPYKAGDKVFLLTPKLTLRPTTDLAPPPPPIPGQTLLLYTSAAHLSPDKKKQRR